MIAKSVFFFLLAGPGEIGGGYLIWQWVRGGRGLGAAVAGALPLVTTSWALASACSGSWS